MDPAEYIVDLRESFSGIWERAVEDRFNAEVVKIKEAGAKNNPYVDAFSRLEQAELEFAKRGADENRCMRDVDMYAADIIAAEPEFWKKRLGKATTDIERSAVHSGVLHQWRHDLETMLEQWKETYADEEVAKVFQDLVKRLAVIDKLRNESRKNGVICFGRGWDLSTSELMDCDADALLTWKRTIESDPELVRICDLIGRSVESKKESKHASIMCRREYRMRMMDRNIREEIDGLSFGRRVEDVVPSELAACADEDLEVLFDLKFIEGRLLSFDKIGQTEVLRTREEMEKVRLPTPDGRGPVIVCVDTSGSMLGKPECVAKAVTLAVAMRARSEKRKCFLIQTSTQSRMLDLSSADGLGQIIKFLSQSFTGGTDADLMIGSVIEAMARPGYEASDMLMVSDLIFGDNVEPFVERMRKQRRRGNRFYALDVRDDSGLTGFSMLLRRRKSEKAEQDLRCGFDRMWKYDIGRKTIQEIMHEPDDQVDKFHSANGRYSSGRN